MVNARRLEAVARKEFLHVVRDWRSLYLAIAIPLLLMMLFGYALDLDLKNVPTVVWDQSRTPQSRDFLSLFDGSPYFSIRWHTDTYRDLEQALDSGRAMIALVIPGDFADRLGANQPVSVQVLVDGSDANTARLALVYTEGLGRIYDQNVQARRMAVRGRRDLVEPVAMEPRAWYNSDLHSQYATIPGILVIVMIVIAAMLTSVTVAREWETGTMEQLISTPVRPPELIVGKVIPYFLIGMTDVMVSMILGRLLFGVPLRGNAALLFLLSSVFLTGALFWGLFLSIVLKTQVLANQIALVSGYLPSLFLSGFVFAIENMPLPIQAITYIVPARYYIAILRGIYLKGIGLEILWIDALLLGLYALVVILLAHKRLKLKLG